MSGRPRPVVTTGNLPGSGRPFRVVVAEHAAGVVVAAADASQDPFVALVHHRVSTIDVAADIAAVTAAMVSP